MEEARWGAIYPGMFMPVLMIGPLAQRFASTRDGDGCVCVVRPFLHRPKPPLLLGVDRATAIEPCLRWGESFSWAELHSVIAHPGAVNGNHLFPTPGPCELRVCHYLLHHHLPPLPGQGHGITKPGVLRLVAPPARCLSAGQREFTLLAQHLFYRKFIFVS